MSDKVVELNRRVVSLEKEVLRFERNCVAMQEYQASLLKVAQVWVRSVRARASPPQRLLRGAILTQRSKTGLIARRLCARTGL